MNNGTVDGATSDFCGQKFQECTKFLHEELSRDKNRLTMHFSGGRDEELKGYSMELEQQYIWDSEGLLGLDLPRDTVIKESKPKAVVEPYVRKEVAKQAKTR